VDVKKLQTSTWITMSQEVIRLLFLDLLREHLFNGMSFDSKTGLLLQSLLKPYSLLLGLFSLLLVVEATNVWVR